MSNPRYKNRLLTYKNLEQQEFKYRQSRAVKRKSELLITGPGVVDLLT